MMNEVIQPVAPSYGANMMIVHSTWMGKPNFSLIPVSLDCPFVEALFEPDSKNLVVFSKSTQTKFRMLPKVDENGDVMTPKKPRKANVGIMEERRQMESFVEHYVATPGDIKNFLERFVVNLSEVDYAPFLVPAEAPEQVLNKV